MPTTLPFTLLNGSTADANQVMANFNALLAALNNATSVPAYVNAQALRDASFVPYAVPPIVSTTGYAVADDGGGGFWIWVVGSTAPDNGGVILEPTAGGTGRWIRMFSGNLNVKWFGATGDGNTPDSAAINRAVAYWKLVGGNALPVLSFASYKNTNYYLDATINLTGLRDTSCTVDLGGAVLLGHTTGQPMVDGLNSEFLKLCNGTLFGDAIDTPSIGYQIGRGIVNVGAANCTVDDVLIDGTHSTTCFYNGASEVFLSNNFKYRNSHATGATYIADGRNALGITSQFFTVTQPVNTAYSFNDVLMLDTSLEQIGGASAPAAIIIGPTNSHHIQGYAQAPGSHAFEIRNDNHTFTTLDVHCEEGTLVNYVLLKTSISTINLRGFKMKEYYNFATDSLINTDGTNSAFFYSSQIEVDDGANAVPIFGSTGTIEFHGDIRLGRRASLYDLSNLHAMIGTVYAVSAESNVILPFINSVTVYDHDTVSTQYYGSHYVQGALLEEPGIPIASASTITIPPHGAWFNVTGNVGIHNIVYNAAFTGRKVRLSFAGTPTVFNGIANNLLLQGNFVATVGSMLTLYGNGSVWQEEARAQNVVV